MNDREKSREELLNELLSLRESVSRLENSEALLKKAQETLREETIRRRILVEQSTDGIVVLTTDGKVFEANHKYADMLGYTFEEAQKLCIWDWEKSFPRETVLTMIETDDEKGNHFETRHTRKDGSEYDVEISTNGTMCGGRKLIFCVCRDITERKRNEERIKENEGLLSTFIDHFQGIAYQVPVEELDSFSPRLFRGAIEEITGYSAADLDNGANWLSIVYPDDTATLQNARRHLLTAPDRLCEVQYRIRTKSGTAKWICDSSRIVTLGNKKLVHGTIFDITSQKTAEETSLQLEEQMRHSQKLEAIGTLAGGVAHDFNNLLGIIMGYSDLALAELAPDSRTYEKLRHVKKASLRAREIIKQLLTFSRKVGPKKQPLNLSTIITETMTFLHSTIPSSITFEWDPPENKMMVFADPTQMHQVIMNLCVNASQALGSREGIIAVEINRKSHTELPAALTLPEESVGSYITVSVIDTGSGIPPEIIERIFEPYFTTRDTGKGTGMGLAVVHGIIENHGGDIIVENSTCEGTTFTFALPELSRTTDDTDTKTETTITGSESVLFIDDEEEITAIARLMLENRGFKVTIATDPVEALALFKKDPSAFDIVITDMTMPHLNGDQVFNEVRALRSDIPVVLCTGHSSIIDEQKAREMGIAAYILKPLSEAEFTGIVRTVLDKK